MSKTGILCLSVFLNYCFLQANDTPRKNFTVSGDVFGTRSFIENKGQFPNPVDSNEKVLYLYEHGNEKIYFTAKGLIFEHYKTFPLTERQMEAVEHGKNVKEKEPLRYFIRMNWVGADAEMKLEGGEKQQNYFTYGTAEYNSYAFKKLTYRNVYPGIDIEYVIPENKDHGVKYSVLLDPGADPGKVKILYQGDMKKLREGANGEIRIISPLDEITEYAPSAYYENQRSVPCRFTLNKDTIGFKFPDAPQLDQRLIIDPWVTAVSVFTVNNLVYDIDYDFGGNAFVFGSFSYAKVAMYNLQGILQWTFSGNMVNPAWTSQIGITGSVGNFVVHKLQSKTYIGQGANYPKIIRLDPSGNYDNFITPINQLYQELWEMGFHCTSGEIYVLGGGHTSNTSAAIISTLNANLVLSTFQPQNLQFVHDISLQAMDDFGNLFVYYACSNAPLNHKIAAVNQTYNGNLWTMPSTFSVILEINNKTAFGGGNVPSAGFNGMAVNNNYLYYYDGLNLAAYSKTTGTIIASTTTGLLPKKQGGIAVDDCNVLYVGGNGSILTYSFNGVSFNTLAPIPLAVNAPTPTVFDVKLDRGTKTLFVSGYGFAGTYSAILSLTCGVPLGLCIFNQGGIAASSTSITCATLGSATVTPNGGLGPFTYTWLPSGQTGPTANGLSPGTYTILLHDAGYNITYTTTTTFVSAVPLTGILASSGGVLCNGDTNGFASINNLSGGSGNQSYQWIGSQTTQTTAAAQNLGAGTYTVIVTDALTGCVLDSIFTITQPPPLISYILASSPSVCAGGTIHLNGISAGGIPGTYSYSWTGGPLTNTHIVSQPAGGTYSYYLTSKDQNSCTVNASISVDFISNPALTINNVFICPFETATLTAAGASSYTWNNTYAGNSYTMNPLVNTAYTVLGEALTCTSVASASVIIKPVPNPVFSSNSPVCNGSALNLNVTQAASYLWAGPQSYSSFVKNPQISPATPAHSGVYQVTVTAANNCTASASGNVTVHPSPTVSATGGTVCSNQALQFNSASVPGALFIWTGPGQYTSALQNPSIPVTHSNHSGNYTLTVTGPPGCTNSAIANVTVTTLPVIYTSANSPKCFGETLSLLSTGALQYNWTGPGGFSSQLNNPFISNISPAQSGVYSVQATKGPCIVNGTVAVIVHPLPNPTIQSNEPVCDGKKLTFYVTGTDLTNAAWNGPLSFASGNIYNAIDTALLAHKGIYTVTVTDKNNCINTATLNVEVLSNPILSAASATICRNEAATLTVTGADKYVWNGPGGFHSSSAQPVIPVANIVAIFEFTVTGTAANSCTSISTASVLNLDLPVPSIKIEPASRICVNNTITLSGAGGVLYDWNGPGKLHYTGQTIGIVPGSVSYSGDYTLTVADENGCREFTTSVIMVDGLPYAYLSTLKQERCVPFCSDFSFKSSQNSFSRLEPDWLIRDPAGNFEGLTFKGNYFSYCFNIAGNYTIAGSFSDSITSCKNNLNLVVKAYPVPVAGFRYLPENPVENSEHLIFTCTTDPTNLTGWKWHIADKYETFNYSKTNEVIYLFREAGVYPVVLIVENTWGCTDTVIQAVRVEEDFHIYIPNAFTPNSDGDNDQFMAVTRGVRLFEMKIFNRWGTLLFISSDPYQGWNGLNNGKPCQDDVYVCKVTATGYNGETKVFTGHITLFR